jgi:hypothetical protein
LGVGGEGWWWLWLWLAGGEAVKEEEEEEELLESGRIGWLNPWFVGRLVEVVVVVAGCPRFPRLGIQIAGAYDAGPCWSPFLLAFLRRSWSLVSISAWLGKDGG